jgi:hypothetical protein
LQVNLVIQNITSLSARHSEFDIWSKNIMGFLEVHDYVGLSKPRQPLRGGTYRRYHKDWGLDKKPGKIAPTRGFTGGQRRIWYKLVPARQGVIPWQAGTGLHLLAKE